MIENGARATRATRLEQERQELVVAIELVGRGAASRVLVANLGHARELIARLTARATLAGVTLLPTPPDGPRAVTVAPRPTLVD